MRYLLTSSVTLFAAASALAESTLFISTPSKLRTAVNHDPRDCLIHDGELADGSKPSSDQTVGQEPIDIQTPGRSMTLLVNRDSWTVNNSAKWSNTLIDFSQ